MTAKTHQAVREDIRTRIERGEWSLGERIPGEVQLAEDYGCARTTINRALRTLAEEGLLVRKRKGGTRVCQLPVREARFQIPVVREQVESMGAEYSHKVMAKSTKIPPKRIAQKLRLANDQKALRVETVHYANDHPFGFEERWLNLAAVPEISDQILNEISLNEWLVKTVPFSNGEVVFQAVNTTDKIAKALESPTNAAVFVVERTTWFNQRYITTVRLYYQPGYELHTRL